jgi:YegS/Rv2252/BmrU family lipid kinase
MPDTKEKNAVVIYNPTSGTATDIDVCLGAIVHKLCEDLKYVATVRPTRPETDHKDIVQAIGDNVDLVVAVGGDGTIRLVLGALSEAGSKVPVGIVPLGTGNQLARNLGIYEENFLADPLENALAVIAAGHATSIDLGRMNGHYFCVAAGAGPISDAVIMPSRDEKANFKMFAYVGSMLQTFALPPVVFRVKTGSDDFAVTASGIFVTNVGDLGVGTLSDTAQVNDGLLDLCVLNPAEFADYLNLGFRFSGGFVGGQPPYYIRKVSSVTVDVVPVESRLSDLQSIAFNIRGALKGESDNKPRTYESVTAMIDGDACGTTPMQVDVVPNAVRVLTPKVVATS